MDKRPIYLDHHATTPVDRRVVKAMRPYFEGVFANASSRHAAGRAAAGAVEAARARVAALIGARPEEIVFTSGATESNNLALKGAARMYRERGDHIVSSAIEHKSVLAALAALERDGFRVTLVGVDRGGRVDPEDVRRALTPKTILVSVMAANNEIGTIEPVREIGRIARAAGVPFHTDATQAAGKVPFDVEADAVDLASFSAHKMYGPKGVGALYVRSRDPRVRLVPQIDGGGHERGLRSGTANVPGIVGFGAAAEIAAREREADARRLGALRDRLLKGLLEGLDGVTVNGSLEHRLPHNLNVSLSMVESESLLKRLDHIAVSSGAACASANPEPSYVLRAIGVREELIHGAVRFGLGRTNTAGEIGRAAAAFVGEARRLRALSPLYRLAGEEGPGSSFQWEDAPALRKGDS